MRQGRAWLCIGPVFFCLLDGVLTLLGQSDAYWNGQYEQARELNPLGLWPLQQHPALFAAALLGWVGVFGTAIFCLPSNLARPLAFAVQFGHTLGAASWLVRLGTFGWLACVPLLLASRRVLDWTWRQPASPGTPQPGRFTV
jgi:hypothetical protein